MTQGHLRVEHWGTFEVANFGDLLYPIVLAPHLARISTEVGLVGPVGGPGPMGTDRTVRRAVGYLEPGFWGQAHDVDAIVLGGGDLVHPGDALVSVDGRPARFDSWSFAVRSSLLAEVRPLVWNALGVPFDIPDHLAPALRRACAAVDLLAVRDSSSKAKLEAAGVDREIRVVTDTGVLAGDCFSSADRSGAIDRLRAAGRLPAAGSTMVAVHISFGRPGVLAELAGALAEVRVTHPDLDVVFLEMGPTHGDAHGLRIVADHLGSPSWLVTNPTMVEAAAVLGAADAVVTSSYHAVLVGAAFGVPTVAFFHDVHQPSKQLDLARSLDREEWLVDRPSVVASALEAVLAGKGPQDRGRVDALVRDARAHLDSLVDVLASATRPETNLRERDAAHGPLVEDVRVLRHRHHELDEQLTQLDEQVRSARTSARIWEAAYWRQRDGGGPPAELPLLTERIEQGHLNDRPYRWGLVGPLFSPEDARQMASTFPLDGAEERDGTDGRRSWRYQVRCLVPMGGASPVRPHALDRLWRGLAASILSAPYRNAMSALTGVDLSALHLEANVFSYSPGAYQEPHPDLPEKVVTHVLWFNAGWEAAHGGCLRILRSNDIDDVFEELLPELGWSAVFVRSARSWHAVTPVASDAPGDRRALVVTFHRPGSISSMWADEP
ncbi:MAG: polysaccharide pyruvyl transferase family protein [Microthrixaceae bacterium]